jgi:hypothetical protein
MFMQLLLQWESSKYYIFWECVCSLRCSAFNAHAVYCHLWPAQLYSIFFLFLINSMIFKLMNIWYVFWFSLQFLCETFLIPRIKLREIRSKMYIGLHVKYQPFFSDFNETWNFLDRFSKNTQIYNFTKIQPVRAELFHADRQTGQR